jgi:FeS assembly SUF system protein
MNKQISPQELEEKIVNVLKTIYDPEIPVNIYELGLIYDIKITASNEVVVLMTLTAPNCPVAGGMPTDVQDKIKEIPEVTDAKVIITFDPPWNMDLLSEDARLALGLF